MNSNFNLIEVYKAVITKKKQLFWFCLLCTFVTSVTLFFTPKQYKATAIAVPANPSLADKNRISGNNIQQLYPFFGNDGDQDVLIGFLQLPQLYSYLVEKHQLVNYYFQKKPSNILLYKSVELLKKDISILKNANNQIIITIWLKDATLAANICNEAVHYTNDLIKKQWKQQSQQENNFLQTSKNQLNQQKDSLLAAFKNVQNNNFNYTSFTNSLKNIDDKLADNAQMQLSNELAIQTMPNALYLVQPATISLVAERPAVLVILVTTLFCSFLFGILLVLLLNKKP